MGFSAHAVRVLHAGTYRVLKKPIRGLFQLAKQKSTIFALLHFSSTYPVLEKWRRVHAPHAGC
jgi:hypothetical protein